MPSTRFGPTSSGWSRLCRQDEMSLEKKERRKKRGRDKREKEGGTKGERGTDRYTVVRSLSGKMPAGIHTPKKGSDTRGSWDKRQWATEAGSQEAYIAGMCTLHKLKASERESCTSTIQHHFLGHCRYSLACSMATP